MECAARFKKTQVEFETGYYIMDLFDMIETKRKMDAVEALAQIDIQLTPHVGEEGFRKIIGNLQKEAGYQTPPPVFDEKGFEELKMQLGGER